MKDYLKCLLIALDQMLNAVFCGWPDETLSSRAWRLSISGGSDWPRKAIDTVAAMLGDKDHCHQYRSVLLLPVLSRQVPGYFDDYLHKYRKPKHRRRKRAFQ